jgi:hypothetical protein
VSIPIGVDGIIVDGPSEVGFSVRVDDDKANSRGYLILLWKDDQAFDGWVARQEDLSSYFEESGWTVEWIADRDGSEG